MKFKTTSNNLFIKMVFKNKLKNFLKKWLTNKKEFVKLKKLKRANELRKLNSRLIINFNSHELKPTTNQARYSDND